MLYCIVKRQLICMLAHNQKIAVLALMWVRARVAVWQPNCNPSSNLNVNMRAHSSALCSLKSVLTSKLESK